MNLQEKQGFHLHLVSDSTGETLNAMAKAACSQFEAIAPREHIYALVRSPKQLDRALAEIETNPGIVLFTIMKDDLRADLEARLIEMNMPYVSVMDEVLGMMRTFLGRDSLHTPGRQHKMDEEYFSRIDALNYTLMHDDGQLTEGLNEADVILLGVSRTSKTPTSIYLANRGIKVANIPLVPHCPLPPEMDSLTKPLVVGLVASPNRLMQIRRNRLLSLNENDNTDYIDLDAIREELMIARQLFESRDWPAIDVTRKSIEETAAAVLNLLSQRKVDA